jgi:acetyltransferase
MGERLIQEAVEHFRAARVPEYRFPERAASALAVLAQQAEYLEHLRESQAINIAVDKDIVQKVINLRKGSPGFLSASETSAILKAYHLPAVPARLATTSEEAVETAQDLGYPVVLKIASPDITHKSDVGGVTGFSKIIVNSQAAFPQAEIQGVYVQRMLPAGQEVILGAIQDSQFGSMVMFGSGGVEVEGLKDVTFSLAPLTLQEAEWMLENTWAGRRLHGFRNLPPADRQAVLDALKLAEIEINPLRVFPDSQGTAALDVRMRLA